MLSTSTSVAQNVFRACQVVVDVDASSSFYPCIPLLPRSLRRAWPSPPAASPTPPPSPRASSPPGPLAASACSGCCRAFCFASFVLCIYHIHTAWAPHKRAPSVSGHKKNRQQNKGGTAEVERSVKSRLCRATEFHAYGDPTATTLLQKHIKECTCESSIHAASSMVFRYTKHKHTPHLSAMALLICCLVASLSLCSWYSNCSISCTSYERNGEKLYVCRRGKKGKERHPQTTRHCHHNNSQE